MAAAAAPSSRVAAASVPGQQRGSPPPPAGAPPAAAPPPAAAAPGRCHQYSSATYPAAAAAAGAAGSDTPGAVAAADFGDAWYHPEERQQLHRQPLSKPSKRRPPTQHKPTCLLKPRVALGSNKVPAGARWRPREAPALLRGQLQQNITAMDAERSDKEAQKLCFPATDWYGHLRTPQRGIGCRRARQQKTAQDSRQTGGSAPAAVTQD